jgi:hypothetical protein
LPEHVKSVYCHHIDLWALIDSSTRHIDELLGDAVDVFLGEEEARRTLAGVLADEPGWAEILSVRCVATVDVSPN